MRVTQRYIALLVVCAALLLLLVALRDSLFVAVSASRRPSIELDYDGDSRLPHRPRHAYDDVDRNNVTFDPDDCRMSTCFDYSKCPSFERFKVFVYPVDRKENLSPIYDEILQAIKASKYYTEDPRQACLFVPSLDTLDRDTLSRNYVHNLDSKLSRHPLWRGGRNHLLFNLYAGTWPEYREHELALDSRGRALLVKASASEERHRRGFDISFPLIHASHASKGGETTATPRYDSSRKRYRLVFKGKRYLTGIGSETRNSLHHVHNGQDVVLLTTCRHGQGWQKAADSRCDTDNSDYDKYDYKVLLHNSTFCLVPRGRRLGSFRYLEALQAACIPVLLSNGWVLPFDEVIDWNRAAIWGDERLLLQVPSLVRSMSQEKILESRQQAEMLWNAYFSSVSKIVDTTLEILKERIFPLRSRPTSVWNTYPGALLNLAPTPATPSSSPSSPPSSPPLSPPFPSSISGAISPSPPANDAVSISPDGALVHRYDLRDPHDLPDHRPARPGFTAAINVHNAQGPSKSPVLKSLVQCKSLQSVLLLCTQKCNLKPIKAMFKPQVHVMSIRIKNAMDKYQYYDDIRNDAILTLGENVTLSSDEIEFAFHVWTNFPERLVGFEGRSHRWNEIDDVWSTVSRATNDYSTVNTDAAFQHRYYWRLMSEYLSNDTSLYIVDRSHCDSLAMNMLASHACRRPPLKVGGRYDSLSTPATSASLLDACLRRLVRYQFGYQPLMRSAARADPLLFKDAVSIQRKKYRRMETVT